MLLNPHCQAALNPHHLIRLYHCHMGIGIRLKQIRSKLDLSQERFGELCGGVTKGMVSQWERDGVTPPVDRLIELRKNTQEKISFSIDWIYTGEIDTATEIAQGLSTKERQAWFRQGRAFAEPSEGSHGNAWPKEDRRKSPPDYHYTGPERRKQQS